MNSYNLHFIDEAMQSQNNFWRNKLISLKILQLNNDFYECKINSYIIDEIYLKIEWEYT